MSFQHKSRFLLQRFSRENARCFEKLTSRVNFSQTSEFREAKASESGGGVVRSFQIQGPEKSEHFLCKIPVRN
jgi:hypothetical protein